MNFSYSRINTYLKCPYKFKRLYLDKIKIQPSDHLVLGDILHKVICLYTNLCLQSNREERFDEWENCVKAILKDYEISEDIETQVYSLMKSYAESHIVELDSIVGVEEKFLLDSNFNPVLLKNDNMWFDNRVAFFRSIIDKLQIKGNYCKITDYKTGWTKADKFQNKIYAWIVSKHYPQLEVFQVACDYIRTEWVDSYEIHKEDLPKIETKVFNIIKKIINDNKLEPKVSTSCSECEVWHTCPAMKNIEENLKMPENLDAAKQLIDNITVLDKKKREANKLLKQYCQNIGEVIKDDKRWGFKAQESWKFDLYDLVTILNEENISANEYLSIDNKKLNMIMKNERLHNKLKDYGTKKISIKFKSESYNKEGDDDVNNL